MKRLSLFLCLLALLHTAAQARVIYVDATATGAANGTSWADAYPTLSQALTRSNAAATPDSILIAAGVYYPAGLQSSTLRDSSFCIFRGGIRLYGGFPTGGGVRNTTTHKVFLDGDINSASTSTDNSRHVLVISGLSATADTVLVDGLTIRNGYANGNNAVDTFNAQPVTRRFGGGVYLSHCYSPALLFNGCVIRDNASIGNIGTTSPVQASYSGSGGGLFVDSATFEMCNCIVVGNTTRGGATPGARVASAESYGGGVSMRRSTVGFFNCGFYRNVAQSTNYGNGGPFGTPSIRPGYGGAIYNNNSLATIINCTFARDAAWRGFVNATGTAIYTSATTAIAPVITNCIFWKNASSSSVNNSRDTTAGITGGATVTYSLSWRNMVAGTGNIANTDPLFVDTLTDNYHLKATSPAINAGSNAALPASLATDADGASRIVQGTVDMGLYEAPVSGLLGRDTLCTGATTVLSGYPAGGTYSSSDTAVAKIDTAGVVTPIAAGTVTMTYTSGASVSTLVMTLIATPTLASIVGGGGPAVCPGSPIALSHPTPGGVWKSSNAAVATVNPNTGVVTGALGGTANISYTVYGAAGTVCDAVVTTSVTILAKPAFSNINPTPALCIGAPPVQLTGSSAGATLVWSGSDTVVATVSNTGLVTPLSTGTVVITLTATGANGCTSSYNYNMTASALPVTYPITGPSSVCLNDTIRLSTATTGGYWWSNDMSVALVDPYDGVVTGIGGGTVAILYSVDNGPCGVAVAKNITVIQVSVDPITGSDSVCLGATILLSNATSGGTWSSISPDTATVSATGMVTGQMNGNAYIVYTATQGACKDSVLFPLTVAASNLSPVISSNGTVLSTGFFSGYSWALNGTPIPGAINRIFTPTVGGSYTVTVTDSGGCTGTSAPFTALGVEDMNSLGLEASIYPNPTTGQTTISGLPEGSLLTLSDITGKVLLQTKTTAAITTLDVSPFVPGIYLLRTPLGTQKVVKE